jgi:hypothetical protein
MRHVSARTTVGRQMRRALKAVTLTNSDVAVVVGSFWRSIREAAGRQVAADQTTPGRRGLQLYLGLIWLLDAALQYQPFMFGPAFVTRIIEPAAAGNPRWVTSPVTWASHVMLHNVAAFNTVFASVLFLATTPRRKAPGTRLGNGRHGDWLRVSRRPPPTRRRLSVQDPAVT